MPKKVAKKAVKKVVKKSLKDGKTKPGNANWIKRKKGFQVKKTIRPEKTGSSWKSSSMHMVEKSGYWCMMRYDF